MSIFSSVVNNISINPIKIITSSTSYDFSDNVVSHKLKDAYNISINYGDKIVTVFDLSQSIIEKLNDISNNNNGEYILQILFDNIHDYSFEHGRALDVYINNNLVHFVKDDISSNSLSNNWKVVNFTPNQNDINLYQQQDFSYNNYDFKTVMYHKDNRTEEQPMDTLPEPVFLYDQQGMAPVGSTILTASSNFWVPTIGYDNEDMVLNNRFSNPNLTSQYNSCTIADFQDVYEYKWKYPTINKVLQRFTPIDRTLMVSNTGPARKLLPNFEQVGKNGDGITISIVYFFDNQGSINFNEQIDDGIHDIFGLTRMLKSDSIDYYNHNIRYGNPDFSRFEQELITIKNHRNSTNHPDPRRWVVNDLFLGHHGSLSNSLSCLTIRLLENKVTVWLNGMLAGETAQDNTSLFQQITTYTDPAALASRFYLMHLGMIFSSSVGNRSFNFVEIAGYDIPLSDNQMRREQLRLLDRYMVQHPRCYDIYLFTGSELQQGTEFGEPNKPIPVDNTYPADGADGVSENINIENETFMNIMRFEDLTENSDIYNYGSTYMLRRVINSEVYPNYDDVSDALYGFQYGGLENVPHNLLGSHVNNKLDVRVYPTEQTYSTMPWLYFAKHLYEDTSSNYLYDAYKVFIPAYLPNSSLLSSNNEGYTWDPSASDISNLWHRINNEILGSSAVYDLDNRCLYKKRNVYIVHMDYNQALLNGGENSDTEYITKLGDCLQYLRANIDGFHSLYVPYPWESHDLTTSQSYWTKLTNLRNGIQALDTSNSDLYMFGNDAMNDLIIDVSTNYTLDNSYITDPYFNLSNNGNKIIMEELYKKKKLNDAPYRLSSSDQLLIHPTMKLIHYDSSLQTIENDSNFFRFIELLPKSSITGDITVNEIECVYEDVSIGLLNTNICLPVDLSNSFGFTTYPTAYIFDVSTNKIMTKTSYSTNIGYLQSLMIDNNQSTSSEIYAHQQKYKIVIDLGHYYDKRKIVHLRFNNTDYSGNEEIEDFEIIQLSNRNRTTFNNWGVRKKEPTEIINIFEADTDISAEDIPTEEQLIETLSVNLPSSTSVRIESIPNITADTNPKVFKAVIEQLFERNETKSLRINKESIPLPTTAKKAIAFRKDIIVVEPNRSEPISSIINSTANDAVYIPMSLIGDFSEFVLESGSKLKITRKTETSFELAYAGNVVGSFLEGESYKAENYTFIFGSTTIIPDLVRVPCFLKGTKILTHNGYKCIENITKKDKVAILEPNTNTISYTKIYNIDKYNSSVRPYCIQNGMFKYMFNEHDLVKNNNTKTLEHSDLYITGNHCIFYKPKNVFFPCKYLTNIHQINAKDTNTQYSYYHISTNNYFSDIIIANGVPCETCGDYMFDDKTINEAYLKLMMNKTCMDRNGIRKRLSREQVKNIHKKYKKSNSINAKNKKIIRKNIF